MKKILNTVLMTLAILALFGISELIFIYGNRPRLLDTYYLFAAQNMANIEPEISIKFIILGAEKYNMPWKNVDNPYPEEFANSKIEIPQNILLENDFKNYFKSMNFIDKYEHKLYSYPRVLYDLALISYKNNAKELFVSLMELATTTDLDMGYWPIELANYYYSIGKYETANQILDNCQKIPIPKAYCGEMKTFFEDSKASHEVGFLKNATDGIFDQISKRD